VAEQSEEQRGEVVAAGRVAAEVLARHEHAGAEHGAALQAAEVRPHRLALHVIDTLFESSFLQLNGIL